MLSWINCGIYIYMYINKQIYIYIYIYIFSLLREGTKGKSCALTSSYIWYKFQCFVWNQQYALCSWACNKILSFLQFGPGCRACSRLEGGVSRRNASQAVAYSRDLTSGSAFVTGRCSWREVEKHIRVSAIFDCQVGKLLARIRSTNLQTHHRPRYVRIKEYLILIIILNKLL